MTGHALLRNYAKRNGLTPAALARELERSGPLVWMWLAGKRVPNRENALHIEGVTGGAVRAVDWSVPASSSRGSSGGTPRVRKSSKRVENARAATKAPDISRN